MSNVIDLNGKIKEKELNSLEIRNISTATEHDTTLNTHYTQTLGAVESPDFFVPEEAPVFVDYKGNMIESETKKAIVNSDTGELVSIVGSGYKLIPNSTVFGQFDEALSESGIDLEGAYKTVHECRGGAQTVLGYSFPAYETTITNREVGDVIRLSVTAVNSYDGFKMFESKFSSMKLACLNSMVSGTDISYFSGKHTQNLVVEHAIEKIKRSIEVFLEHGELYKRWSETKISNAQAETMFEKFCVKKGYKTEFNEKKVLMHMDQWAVESNKLGKTKWALYNTLTHWATHAQVQKRSVEAGNSRLRQLAREEKLRTFLTTKTDWFAKAA